MARGPYTGIFDMIRRLNSHHINKRCLESLAKAGAFDCFENTHRAQFFHQENSEDSIFLEKIVRHGADYHARKDSIQQSLFGEAEEVTLTEMGMPDCRPWSKMEQLKFEKDVTGFYMSGHPLDEYRTEIDYFCSRTIEDLKQDLKPLKGKEFTFAGIVIEANHRIGKTGKPYGSFVVEDYLNFVSLTVFSEDYLRWKHLMEEGQYIFLKARVESRFDNPDQMAIRVSQITLLSEAMEKFAKTLTLSLHLESVTPALVKKLQAAVKQHKGKCQLRMRIHDAEGNFTVDLPSRKHRVNAKEFLVALREMPEITFRLYGEP
jgi:DNA polymerase-3 subunit alpha